MFLVFIIMLIFRFNPSKKILQLFVLQKIFIFTFSLCFKVNSYFLNKTLQKKNYNVIRISLKKLDFFNKTWIKYEFLYFWRLKIYI